MSSRSMRLLAWCVLLALSSGLAGAEDVCDDGGPDAFFPTIEKVVYDPSSRAPLAFRHYNAEEEVCVKEDCRAMKDWLRFSVAFWHTIRGDGSDPFGSPTKSWPWEEGEMSAMARAKVRLRAIFEFLDKLGVEYWCFHDRDIAPEGQTLQETKANLDAIVEQAKELQEKHDKKLLWGTAQLFHHKRYINGAATSPDSRVYAYAAAMVAMAMDATKKLQGQNFVFWGGREGYQSLLNSDIKQELDQLGAFMSAAADYKEEIGFDGELLIEPKPQEPMKHQYDFDVATTANFLRMNNLEGKFKINVECNHATLSGHSCEHELRTASIQGLLGNVDINTGDPQTGWDTDQFLTDPVEATRLMLTILEQGGLGKGGLNFDAKLRRESVDVEDLFYAHISGMDAMARGLKQAAAIINDGR
uniref:Xylose isomerase n=1 Tax=Chloropicon primus TaxID=1764295 RepID=A0A7S2T0R9_9CHLO|mmetsp:Transcript_2550/g.7036  ORF Transcript_2550/g.7036 Transcript_2550/m.7036 type:complete len:415 (+) Transcript_2550:93-1337(+)